MSPLFLFASLGVVNGLILAIYLLVKKQRSVADMYFAGLLLALCLRIGKSVWVYFDPELDKLILQIGLSACHFIGPFYFLYSKAVYNHQTRILKFDRHLLQFLLIGILVAGVQMPYRAYPEFWNETMVPGLYIIWAGFSLVGLYQNRVAFQRLVSAKQKLTDMDKHMLGISLAYLFITFTFQFALFVKGITYIWGSIIFSASFYYLIIRALIIKKTPVPNTLNLPPLNDGKALLAKLDQMMQEDKPHLDPKLKLDHLASQAELTRHTLSRLLNEEYAHGFAHYVKSYRLEEAKRLILTRNELSLEGIGYEAGFNSKSAFYEAFKNEVGMTPARFKKQYSQNGALISPE